MQRNLLSALDF